MPNELAILDLAIKMLGGRGRFIQPRYRRRLQSAILAERKPAEELILFVPGRTDTRWFRLLRDSVVCFIHGRVRFESHRSGTPFPSLAVYVGTRERHFNGVFSRIRSVRVRCGRAPLDVGQRLRGDLCQRGAHE